MANSGGLYQGTILGLVDMQDGVQDAKAAEDIKAVLLLISEAMENDIPLQEEDEGNMPHWAQYRQ